MKRAATPHPCCLTLPACGNGPAVSVTHTMPPGIERSRSMVLITDLHGRIEYVNEAFVRTTGYSRQEVLGHNPRMLQSGRTTAQTHAEMWTALQAGKVWWGELHNRRKDGSAFTERACVMPLRLPSGLVTHYLATKEAIAPDPPAQGKPTRRLAHARSTHGSTRTRPPHQERRPHA